MGNCNIGRPTVALMHLFVWIQLLLCCKGESNMGCHESEKAALTEFRNGLVDPLHRLSSWDGPDCCKWRGIECENTTGFVIKLDLHNPYDIYEPSEVERYGYWNLSGTINPALLKLKSLRHLDLSRNTFDGIPIPGFLGSLKGLKYLNLSSAGFSGVIPWQLGTLSDLEVLVLSSSAFPLRADDLEWVSNLSSLQHLEMEFVNLSMANDNWLQVMNHVPNLIVLRLSICGLTDIFPSISSVNFTSLRVLDLSNNLFSSEIPTWIANLSNLVSLELSGCKLRGPIHFWLSEIPHLQVLNLATNYNLTANLSELVKGNWKEIKVIDLSENQIYGEIPAEIGNLTSLVRLRLSYNGVKGSIPRTIGNLCSLTNLNLYGNMIEEIPKTLDMRKCSCQNPFQKLAYLMLGGNPINGPMPDWFGQLKNLEWMDLEDCLLTGPILASIGGLPSLYSLQLARNHLNGTYPASFGQLSNLTYLDLSSNSLTGIISESHFEKLSKLKILRVSSNSLVFRVSENWVPPFQLEVIDLQSCHLGPQFPSWLRAQNLTKELYLFNASISDEVPDWFWDFASHVELLNLSNNNIHGRLPKELLMPSSAVIGLNSNNFHGSIPLPLNQVSQLDLSNNELSGPIPANITQVMRFAFLFSISGNRINGTIPSTMGELQVVRVLDFSNNDLVGTIPPSLADCLDLEALDLSRNHLSGGIPQSMGLLTQLRSLHLNNNSLSGEFPLSLKNCTKLETLDLGENGFFGNIPTWIGESFPYLRILRLRSNRFTGMIPTQISHLTYLQVLDLAHNSLTGTIPHSFVNLTSMHNVRRKNGFVGYGTIKGVYYMERLFVWMQDGNFEYNTTLSFVTSMDLSSNQLDGEIPRGLMRLSGLIVLNLSANHLRGRIPEEISSLQMLMKFDVSNNLLTGPIPSSMISMTFLNDVNFSNNNFSGKILQGTSFRRLRRLHSLEIQTFVDHPVSQNAQKV